MKSGSTGQSRPEPDAEPPRAGPALALAMIDALELPAVACDGGGRLVLANAAARALWGLGDDLQGPASGEWFEPDLQPGEAPRGGGDPLTRALTSEGPTREWRCVLTAEGEPRPVLVGAAPLLVDGELLGALMQILAFDREPATERRLRNYAFDLEMLTEASRMLSEVSDPDQAAAIIGTVATGSTGAIVMLLWETRDDGLYLAHHESGLLSDVDGLAAEARAGAERALAQSSTEIDRLKLEDLGMDPTELAMYGFEPGEGDSEDAIPLTVWHEPLSSSGCSVGVLSVLWVGDLDDIERPAGLIVPLAHHAATALERAELLRRLQVAARTDPLTGVANRRVWQERLEHELARCERDGHPFSLILIDIDHFKGYNDRNGHPAGDVLLRDAAKAWTRRLRRTDLLARIGGEEFAVILPGCTSADVGVVADGLLAAMPCGETCSLGIVTCSRPVTATELYAAADAALYRAKRRGRNRATVGKIGRDGGGDPAGPIRRAA